MENPINVGQIHYYRLRGKNGFRSRYGENDFAQLKKIGGNGIPDYFVFNNASMLFDARNCIKSFEKIEKNTPETETTPIENVPKPVETPVVISEWFRNKSCTQ